MRNRLASPTSVAAEGTGGHGSLSSGAASPGLRDGRAGRSVDGDGDTVGRGGVSATRFVEAAFSSAAILRAAGPCPAAWLRDPTTADRTARPRILPAVRI